jgi:hypothetical protein
MFIAIPLLLPLVAVIAILVSPLWCITIGSPFERQTNKKRLLIFFFSSLAFSAIISVILWNCGTAKIWDKEVWNYKIVNVRHEERWTEEETRTRQVACGTDKDGNTEYRTETYHVTETYGPYWKATDEYGNEHGIGESVYQNWKKIWADEKKTGEHKGSSAGFDTAITGGIFECDWTKDFDRIFPWSDIHTYKNKVRYSDSVLKYKEPTKELVKKYPRPADLSNTSPVLSYGKTFPVQDIELLHRTNAELGPRYRAHPILVAFGADTKRDVVDDVLSAWRGPNKNELVTFAAFKGDEIVWCEVHSWMDNTTIHATLRDELISGKFTAKRYSDLLLKYVPKQWRKKDFRDFDYIRVEIHWGWKVGSLLASIAGLLGLFLLIDRVISDFSDFDAIYRRW